MIRREKLFEFAQRFSYKNHAHQHQQNKRNQRFLSRIEKDGSEISYHLATITNVV